MAARYDIVFTGCVQGVYFRATTVDVARRFDVVGWVRNEPDGSVRCVAEGEPAELDRFVAAVREARGDSIDDVRVVRSEAVGDLDSFEIR